MEGELEKVRVTDVMIDIETLSLNTNAVVLSIGMCWWNMKEGWDDLIATLQTHYSVLSLTDQIMRGRHIDESTVKWWLLQSQAARKAIASPSAWDMSTQKALAEITTGAHDIPVERVWSHGAGFDIPILLSLFDDFEQDRPWNFRQFRDTRTLFELYLTSSYANKEEISIRLKPDGETEHNAVADAINQACAVHYTWNHVASVAL